MLAFIPSDFMQPDRDQWKTWLVLGALVLAVANVVLMRIIWKQAFGLKESTYKTLSRLHRACGYTAFGIMLFVAIVTCIGIIGYGGYARRATWHSYLGISVLALMGIKIIAVRKGLPESTRFRRGAITLAVAATVLLAMMAALSNERRSDFVLPLFPLVALVGLVLWTRFGPLPVVGSTLALTIALLFASSGAWWFAHQASAGPRPDVAAVLAIKDPDIELGAQVYRTVGCVACHGPTGTGGVGPNLRDARFAYANTPASIAQRVRQGGGVMPAFGPDKLSDTELAGLVQFIRNWYSQ